jgi:hypothetical protein
MNREDVMRWAREADLNVHDPAITLLQRFAALVAAAEREECAKVCEASNGHVWRHKREDLPAAIRARGQK